MSSPETTRKADYEAVVAAIRAHDRFLVTTHENPDGDALGSLLATTLALRRLGKDAVMYLVGHDAAAAGVRVHEARRAAARGAGDAAERVLVCVDCANESRLGPDPRSCTPPASS